jgi:Xaa-Pro aminopeptidase
MFSPLLRVFLATVLLAAMGFAGTEAYYQTEFPPEEFKARHAKIFDQIGDNAIAIVAGAPAPQGFQPFRQSNDFYYLCGVETPHAYILLNGRTRQVALYLPHRDPGREHEAGRLLTAEDDEQVRTLTGVDSVHPIEAMALHLSRMQIKTPVPAVYTPMLPWEGVESSRDELLYQQALISSDPWDGRPSREAWFADKLRSRYPALPLHDLSPILDEMRLIKSEREISVIRKASHIAAWALVEAMKSTKPGVMEYQLDAVAQYIFLVNGAKFEAYPAIIAGGTNSWMGHYNRNSDPLKDGEMVLMDYAPDYRYYTSDITRWWPVNGKFDADQKAFAKFIEGYRDALVSRIKPGVTAAHVQQEARVEMKALLDTLSFSKPYYRAAAEKALDFTGHLQHPVGMTVHDVGVYRNKPFVEGQVFAVDPMLWVPEEEIYIRMEDVVVVTTTGAENFTDFLPMDPDEIEKLMEGPGIVQQFPARLP